MKNHDVYQSPLVGRYTSKEMQQVWSDDRKFGLWRRMWLAIATAMHKLGVPAITEEHLEDMAPHLDAIDYGLAAMLEKELRHDVMAHNRTFGTLATRAAGIIHYGCTSCDITDNAELIQIKQALVILRGKLARLLRAMRPLIEDYDDLPILGRTHLQPAQPTTVGKRIAIWAQDLLMDLETVHELIEWLPFRGLKGATGTQASFLEIFEGDWDKVKEMERLVADGFGFSRILPITGQTYTRKIDTRVLAALASFAATAHKIGEDIRLLQSFKELEEPFSKHQVGSSAMPHKRNPMRSERSCSLARELMNGAKSALDTQAQQWLERTLDDSAGRRRYLPESFLLADALVILLTNIMQGLVVYPRVIARNLAQEMPFLAGERIIVRMVELGADRQECHERFRDHAHEAHQQVNVEGGDNDLVERLRKDPYFGPVYSEIDSILDPSRSIGAAPRQAWNFVEDELDPMLKKIGVEGGLAQADLSV